MRYINKNCSVRKRIYSNVEFSLVYIPNDPNIIQVFIDLYYIDERGWNLLCLFTFYKWNVYKISIYFVLNIYERYFTYVSF